MLISYGPVEACLALTALWLITVTEFMERGCVRDALTQNADLPWKTIVGMALDAAAGILHLHAEHIVHRVISKPSSFCDAWKLIDRFLIYQDLALRNMLVSRDWRVRMADFGLARMMPKDTYAKTRGNIGAIRHVQLSSPDRCHTLGKT